MRPTDPPIQMAVGGYSHGGKRLRVKSDHSCPPNDLMHVINRGAKPALPRVLRTQGLINETQE
jgi:hypothetical protein